MKRVLLLLLTLTLFNCSEDDTSPDENSGSGTVTDQDGNDYPYIAYGDQIWTVKNTEVVTYRDGTAIPQVTDASEWENLTTGAWCYYDNDPTKSKLYNWYAIMGIHDNDENTPNKEFAPEGWHVPRDEEWVTLENYLIDNGYNDEDINIDFNPYLKVIAKAMASKTGWFGSTIEGAVGNDQSLNNSSGFNALPHGFRYPVGSFIYDGQVSAFWSTDTTSRGLDNDMFYVVYSSGIIKQYGLSVRFVKD